MALRQQKGKQVWAQGQQPACLGQQPAAGACTHAEQGRIVHVPQQLRAKCALRVQLMFRLPCPIPPVPGLQQNVQQMAAQQVLQHSLAAMQGPHPGVLAAMGIGLGGAAAPAGRGTCWRC